MTITDTFKITESDLKQKHQNHREHEEQHIPHRFQSILHQTETEQQRRKAETGDQNHHRLRSVIQPWQPQIRFFFLMNLERQKRKL